MPQFFDRLSDEEVSDAVDEQALSREDALGIIKTKAGFLFAAMRDSAGGATPLTPLRALNTLIQCLSPDRIISIVAQEGLSGIYMVELELPAEPCQDFYTKLSILIPSVQSIELQGDKTILAVLTNEAELNLTLNVQVELRRRFAGPLNDSTFMDQVTRHWKNPLRKIESDEVN